MSTTIVPVILSGGVGTRLWPVSRSSLPKQLQRLLGEQSMIQATALRVAGMERVAPPMLVCNVGNAAQVVDELSRVGSPPGVVVAEPAGRNTGPAVAAAALAAPEGALLLVLPADHVVRDVPAFRAAVGAGVEAARSGHLVTFGIVPGRPETGYGYIEAGETVASGDPPVRRVVRFVEKPDVEAAARYVAQGFLWNSGMFLFDRQALLGEMERVAPQVLAPVSRAMEGAAGTDPGWIEPGEAFLDAPSVSIDTAVMERTDRAVVLPLDAGWSDVGSWAALWEIEEQDADGNVVRGDVEAVDVHRSYLWSNDRLVAVVGLDDVVVVDTGDAVLVAGRERVQDVKALVERLAAQGRPEVD